MLARFQSYLLRGIDAQPCEVEIDADETHLDRQTIVGLPDASVKESIERVRSALTNSGYRFPRGRVLINLAPADVRKESPLYDLPIALGLLAAQGVIRSRAHGDGAPIDPGRTIFAGELALDGRVRPIKGAIAMAALARQAGADAVVVPSLNATEAAVVEGVSTFGVRTLDEAVGLIQGTLELEPTPPPDIAGLLRTAPAPIDFAEVRGQESVKRAVVVAAAGAHNILGLCPGDGHGAHVAKRYHPANRTFRGRRHASLDCEPQPYNGLGQASITTR